MRWLICIAISLISSAVDARRLVRNPPPMARTCMLAKTWPQVVSCLSAHYGVKVTREVKGAKLVTLRDKTSAMDHGVLLYVERAGNWQLGGQFEAYGAEYAVLGLEPITIGKRAGFRLDLGHVMPITLMIDPTSSVPATQRLRKSLFCSGDSYACSVATSACDISVDGHAWYVFRGTLGFEDDTIVIDGNRERAGSYCHIQQKVHLGWTNR